MEVSFSKYSGCGNDFIIIDNRRICYSFTKEVIRRLCHRSLGIGSDGIILLENPVFSKAFYRMRIFNSDGSEAEMCGNGIRCLAHYIHSSEDSGDHFEIETMHHFLKVSFPSSSNLETSVQDNKAIQDFDLESLPMGGNDSLKVKEVPTERDYGSKDCVNLLSSTAISRLICVAMAPPSAIICKKIFINGKEISLFCLDTGVPHVVYFTESIESEDFLSLAPLIRMHPEFQPRGTNVNFVQILSGHSITIRTYERGVENETLACGTGAAASAIASIYAFSLKTPVKVHVRSNDHLFINCQIKGGVFSELTMTGPAIKIFDGKVLV